MQKSFSEYSKQYWWVFVVALIVLTFAGFGIKKSIDNRNSDKSALDNLSRTEIVRQFAETPQGLPTAAAPKVSSTDLRGPSAPKAEVLGSSINANAAPQSSPHSTTTPVPPSVSKTVPPPFKPYRSDSLGFAASVPADTVINATATQATATSPGSRGAYWTLTMYDHTSETLDSLINELSRSPSVTKLARTTLAGRPALEFSSPNLRGGTGFAVINNGRLYYLIGNFSNPLLLKDFKFL